MWIVCGILSVMFTILNWVFTIRNNKKVHWAALVDAVPSMFGFLTGYVAILILVNALAFVCKKHKDA